MYVSDSRQNFSFNCEDRTRSADHNVYIPSLDHTSQLSGLPSHLVFGKLANKRSSSSRRFRSPRKQIFDR
jgi:hypothetical protein